MDGTGVAVVFARAVRAQPSRGGKGGIMKYYSVHKRGVVCGKRDWGEGEGIALPLASVHVDRYEWNSAGGRENET